MSKGQVTDLLNQRQIHRRYGHDLCKLGSRYTLPIMCQFKHRCTLVKKIRPQRCQRICSTNGIRFPSVATVLASMAVVSRLVSPFQLRHTATRTYHFTKNTSSTQSSGANRHTFLDTASCILLVQKINSALPVHLSYFPIILPHVRIPTQKKKARTAWQTPSQKQKLAVESIYPCASPTTSAMPSQIKGW